MLAELYKGIYCGLRIEENTNNLNLLLGRIQVIPFNDKAAEEFGKIQGELRRIGRPTQDFDAAIAAVARSRGDILVTNNTRHFINIADLRLENWLIN